MSVRIVAIISSVTALLVGLFLGEVVFHGGDTTVPPGLRQPTTKPSPLLTRDSKGPPYLLALAEVHFKFGNHKEAETLASQGLKGADDPASRKQLRDLLAKVYEKEQRWDEALKLEEQAAKEPADEHEKYEATLSQAKIHAQLSQLDKAEEILNSLTPTTPNVWRKREISKAYAEVWLKDPARIDRAFEQAKTDESKRPEVTSALEILGLEYKNSRRDPKDVAAVCEKLATLKPDDLQAHLDLAQVWLQAKEYDKAIAEYQRLLKQWPKESSAYAFLLADTMIQAGRKAEAVEWAKGYYGVDTAGQASSPEKGQRGDFTPSLAWPGGLT
jgi:tetratricopeptide (TPR) repeat protein